MNKNLIQKRTFRFISAFLILFFLPFLLSSKAFADNTIPIYGARTYTTYGENNVPISLSSDGICGGAVSGCSLPFDIISSRPSGVISIDLNRFTLEWSFVGFSADAKYNRSTVLVAVNQDMYGNNSSFNTYVQAAATLYYTTRDNSYTISCPITFRSSSQITYECQIDHSNYDPPINASFIAGAPIQSSFIATIGVKQGFYNYNPIRLIGAQYSVISTQDPLISGQNTMINQNQTIINQNNAMLEQNQAVQDKAIAESQRGQSSADSAEVQNVQASTNIVGVIGKVVNAFSTPPASSCSIPVVASGVDLGNVDFCTGKPPFWTQLVGGVGSLILVYACYRVAINMFNLFISLTVFAQGGKSRGSDG